MAEEHDDGGLTALVMRCAFAVIAGQKTVTISSTSGKAPAGFPRGELLSVGTDGSHNYAVCPIKALAWVHARTSAPKPQPPASNESPARGDSTSGVGASDLSPEQEAFCEGHCCWSGHHKDCPRYIGTAGVSAPRDQTFPPSAADAESPARGGQQG